MTLRPLTKRNGAGDPYTRDEAVETQIRLALLIAPAARLDRARIQDRRAPEYLQEEALVYLIQDAFASDQGWLFEDLWTVLLHRCGSVLYGKFRALGTEDAKDAYADAIEQLLLAIIDLEHDRGSFYQVKFWDGLTKLAVSVFRRHWKASRRIDPMSSLLGDDSGPDEGDDEEPAEDRNILGHTRYLSPPDHVLIVDALAHIPPHCRDAFVLRHYHNWQIESKDSAEPTISEALDKTPRTIRNWLKTAEEAVAAWRGATP